MSHLARLEFSEEETEKMTSQLDKMIRYAEMLNEFDTTNVELTSHVLKMRNVMREDIPEPGMPREEILKNAPDHKSWTVQGAIHYRVRRDKLWLCLIIQSKELHEMLERKEISVTDTVDESFRRIAEVDSDVQAFLTLDEERARNRQKN